MYNIHPETIQDFWEVEYLLDLSFAPGREALSSYRLRDDVPFVSSLSIVARDEDNILAGCIRYWPVYVGSAKCLLLGPIAVHPTRQGEGLGGILMRNSLSRAKKDGWERVILVGDEPYYKRFGFTRADFLDYPPPTNPERVLALELIEGAFDGVSGLVTKFPEKP